MNKINKEQHSDVHIPPPVWFCGMFLLMNSSVSLITRQQVMKLQCSCTPEEAILKWCIQNLPISETESNQLLWWPVKPGVANPKSQTAATLPSQCSYCRYTQKPFRTIVRQITQIKYLCVCKCVFPLNGKLLKSNKNIWGDYLVVNLLLLIFDIQLNGKTWQHIQYIRAAFRAPHGSVLVSLLI